MKELNEAIKKAKQVEEQAKLLQQQLEATQVTGGTENRVLAVFSGAQAPLQIIIAENLMTESAETIAAEVLAASRDAYSQSFALMQKRVEELTSGLGIVGYERQS